MWFPISSIFARTISATQTKLLCELRSSSSSSTRHLSSLVRTLTQKQQPATMAKQTDGCLVHPPCPRLSIPTHSVGGRIRIQAILDSEDLGKSYVGQTISACGWSRTVRKQGAGEFCFIALGDGSTGGILQVVVHSNIAGYDQLLKAGVGCSFKFTGEIVESPAAGQSVEMVVKDPTKHSFTMFGGADQSKYPLSKKKHGREFLREIAHLRPRTFLIGAVTRVRSQLAMATHRFFQDRGFQYIHTPIITGADCEGAGELFQVTTLMKDNIKDIPTIKGPGGVEQVDYKKDFFGKPAFLTVSGQLNVENFACALCDVYTFGPTFRAENSHTSRHLGEFWMIEPEMAFADINDNMQCAEEYLKYCVEWALQNCRPDIHWLEKNIEEGLVQRLENVLAEPFVRITYTEAIEILKKSEVAFEAVPDWGMDMGAEHERYLTENVYKKPVIVYNYPKSFKAFYMRQNEDGKTVAAMDVLLPKIGEVIGGSQREERLEYLDRLLAEKGLDQKPYWWYRELRDYGSVPHCGFGLGFERLIMMITGVDNIRDVIPFPRYPGHAEF